MVLEMAILDVIPSEIDAFEDSFRQAQEIISSMKGYISHELHKCVEKESRYVLLVSRQTIDEHTIGFRTSDKYRQWKALLHHYYDPFPIVEHYILLYKNII